MKFIIGRSDFVSPPAPAYQLLEGDVFFFRRGEKRRWRLRANRRDCSR
jgi:uncharacterized cupin superfamily protein